MQTRLEVFYSDDYVLDQYDLSTFRKAGWLVHFLAKEPVPCLEIVNPKPSTQVELSQIHSAEYVEAIRIGQPRNLAESQALTWHPSLWKSVLASTGGVVASARVARRNGIAGSLSSGLHHAKYARGAGYCTFNGLALAAHSMIAEGAKHVLILDLDAHCGGGTHSLVENLTNVWHLDIAVNEYDIYVPSGHNSLDLVTDHQDYLPVVKSRLSSLDQKAPGFDICLYNAGMDPHEGCTIGGLKGITLEVLREREYLVFEWFRQRRVPIAFVIAGGYTSVTLNQSDLVQLHRLTLEAAAMVFCR